MKVLQINATVNTTSTGRIAEEIGLELIKNGHESIIAYKNCGPAGSSSDLIKIGNKTDEYVHGLKTRLFDLHGFGSKNATKKLVETIKMVDPDVIGLHNLHGYYINIELLFAQLKELSKPVIWTFHDCWPFTGHCAFFDTVNCNKWINGCNKCPLKNKYPASYFWDNSKSNYKSKKEIFNSLDNLTIVTPSVWLSEMVKKSFLSKYPVCVINNGIDIDIFTVKHKFKKPDKIKHINKHIILGVASVWDARKGYSDFLELSKHCGDKYQIVLVGLSESQIRELPDNMIGISRTENVNELAELYNSAEVFINPTWSDNFPTTNIESLACGTPVITYNTGGSPESIDDNTGFVIEKGDISGIIRSIEIIAQNGKSEFIHHCRNRALSLYNKKDRYSDYISLYKKLHFLN